jgi:Ca2+/Na+ antiporter
MQSIMLILVFLIGLVGAYYLVKISTQISELSGYIRDIVAHTRRIPRDPND